MAKNLVLWMIIAGVLLTVFNNINQGPQADNVNYSQFLLEVRDGRIYVVLLAGTDITARRGDGSRMKDRKSVV